MWLSKTGMLVSMALVPQQGLACMPNETEHHSHSETRNSTAKQPLPADNMFNSNQLTAVHRHQPPGLAEACATPSAKLLRQDVFCSNLSAHYVIPRLQYLLLLTFASVAQLTTPFLTSSASLSRCMLQGFPSYHMLAMPTWGLLMSSSFKPTHTSS